MANSKIDLHTKAPLPFVGQKRNFLKAFRKNLTDHIDSDGLGWTIIDVFGGSGLLANNAKYMMPAARVIYNDFDNYSVRLEHIDDTNRLRNLLSKILLTTPKGERLSRSDKANVLNAILEFDGYKDVQTLASWILFSGKQISTLDELSKCTMYNMVRQSDYPSAKGYLDNIEIVSESFESLMIEHQKNSKALFILDPPYVSTKQGAYALDRYFGMVQFLTLMNLVRPPYLLFSSTKSEILSFMNYIKDNRPEDWDRFGSYESLNQISYINKSVSYVDNILYRWD